MPHSSADAGNVIFSKICLLMASGELAGSEFDDIAALALLDIASVDGRISKIQWNLIAPDIWGNK